MHPAAISSAPVPATHVTLNLAASPSSSSSPASLTSSSTPSSSHWPHSAPVSLLRSWSLVSGHWWCTGHHWLQPLSLSPHDWWVECWCARGWCAPVSGVRAPVVIMGRAAGTGSDQFQDTQHRYRYILTPRTSPSSDEILSTHCKLYQTTEDDELWNICRQMLVS